MRLEELYPLLNQLNTIYIANGNGYHLFSGRLMKSDEQVNKIRKYFPCKVLKINAVNEGIEVVINYVYDEEIKR